MKVSCLLRPQLSQLAGERLKGKVEVLLICKENQTGSQEMWVFLQEPPPHKILCPPVYPLSHGISFDCLLYGGISSAGDTLFPVVTHNSHSGRP